MDPIPAQNSPPPQTPPTAPESLDPGEVDPSLDAALTDLFKTKGQAAPTPPKNEKPNPDPIPQEPKKEGEDKNPPKAEDKKKEPTAKPAESNKPLLAPEAIPDPGKLKNREGWDSLKENYSRAHKTLGEKDKEIEKLKLTLAESENLTKKEKEELKKEIESLTGYRQMIDVQADPQFIDQYEKPIQSTISQIKQLLVAGGASQQLVDQLTMEHMLDQKNVKAWMDAFEKEGQSLSGKRLMNRVENLMDTVEKRDGALKDYKTKYKEFLENRKKESFSKQAESEGQMMKRLEEIKAMKDEAGNPKLLALSQLTPQPGASQAEIDQIQKHNKVAELLEGQVKNYMQTDVPQDRVHIALAAAMLPVKTAELKIANERIQALEKELQKLTVITEEKPSPTAPRGGTSKNGQRIENLDEALTNHFSGIR